jgi:hypothetical protein
MTAKERAEKIIYLHLVVISEESMDGDIIIKQKAKQCALITVNAILKTIPYINNTQEEVNKRVYYIEVSQEINKL